MTWLDACRTEVTARGLDPDLLEVLQAFGGSDAPGPAALDAPLPRDALPPHIEAQLAQEVDAAQAALFARRFRSVVALLDQLPDAEAPLLRVALFRRAAQILGAPPPHALRIRALVDFIWSQAAVVAHRTPGAPSLTSRTRDLEWHDVAPGVQHATLAGPTAQGPVHINLLRARAARIRTLDARRRGPLTELCAHHGAVAGVSGGFFLYSEPDIAPPSQRTDPVGWLVTDGELVGPPVFRRSALIQHLDGTLQIAARDLNGAGLTIGAVHVRVGHDATVVHRAHADRTPSPAGRAVAVVQHHVVAVSTGPLDVPLAGYVLLLPPGPPIRVGDRVTYDLPPVRQAMAGGPLLVGDRALDLQREDFAGTAPPITFSKDETFDRNLLPRLAAGILADGTLVFAAVDGRNADRAPGLTLRSTAGLMRALGCVRALNLDGGSSKRMVVRGRVVDLPSTEVLGAGTAPPRIRPVHTAILVLYPPAAGPRPSDRR